ncbi:arf-GAP domain and FG repeat-containing protein 2 isoform X1 [Protopterus annectens]|uniref:arf-GAP domain and FG repeat-containing protein 2 isoform X1 n=1 Tax=Protopterus annectens TaxID=7888 RepID=UPI001CFB4C28|nr:arf-GAP domain and FG repeat-containing protein 2 isoform X1 [Protopterus annectens]
MSLSKKAKEQEEAQCRRVRELGASPANRHCFECEQRGVTYVDITIGTFVCTTCSGLLRGLNPPHRVKSISMTTFSDQEVEFLQSRGNEMCRKIWMGLFDVRSAVIPDSRDAQKVKEFLQEKYEKKRWYVSPDQVKETPASASTVSRRNTSPEVKPLRTLLTEAGSSRTLPSQSHGGSQTRLYQKAAQQQQWPMQGTEPTKKSNTDLLADMGGDPFAPPQPSQSFPVFPAFGAQMPANSGFANFDAFSSNPAAFGGVSSTAAPPLQSHSSTAVCLPGERTVMNSSSFGGTSAGTTNFANFPKSSSASFGGFSAGQNMAPVQTSASKISVPPADKYAALADLESVFNAGGSNQQTSFVSTAKVTASNSSGMTELGVFGTSVPHAGTGSSASVNAGPAFGVFTNPFTTSAAQVPVSHTNPFQANGVAMASGFGMAPTTAALFGTVPSSVHTAFPQQAVFPLQQNGTGFGSYQTTKVAARPPGQPSGVSTNPFMTGPQTRHYTSGTSTNPFL